MSGRAIQPGSRLTGSAVMRRDVGFSAMVLAVLFAVVSAFGPALHGLQHAHERSASLLRTVHIESGETESGDADHAAAHGEHASTSGVHGGHGCAGHSCGSTRVAGADADGRSTPSESPESPGHHSCSICEAILFAKAVSAAPAASGDSLAFARGAVEVLTGGSQVAALVARAWPPLASRGPPRIA